jgi:hypothetical protein
VPKKICPNNKMNVSNICYLLSWRMLVLKRKYQASQLSTPNRADLLNSVSAAMPLIITLMQEDSMQRSVVGKANF